MTMAAFHTAARLQHRFVKDKKIARMDKTEFNMVRYKLKTCGTEQHRLQNLGIYIGIVGANSGRSTLVRLPRVCVAHYSREPLGSARSHPGHGARGERS